MPTTCPVCGGEYEITRCACTQCGSELSGRFTGCDFCGLSDEEARFVLTFLKCRGSIKEMEKDLGISYPTVKSRLEAVIARLGLAATPASDELKDQRLQALDRLSRGEITPDQAAEILKNLNQ
jgi:hypothetical protein